MRCLALRQRSDQCPQVPTHQPHLQILTFSNTNSNSSCHLRHTFPSHIRLEFKKNKQSHSWSRLKSFTNTFALPSILTNSNFCMRFSICLIASKLVFPSSQVDQHVTSWNVVVTVENFLYLSVTAINSYPPSPTFGIIFKLCIPFFQVFVFVFHSVPCAASIEFAKVRQPFLVRLSWAMARSTSLWASAAFSAKTSNRSNSTSNFF